MAYSIMRFDKLKSISEASGRVKHNRRELDVKTLSTEPHSCPVLWGDVMKRDAKTSFSEAFKQHTKGMHIRKNAVVAVELVLAFTPGAIKADALEHWVIDNMKWTADNFGGVENIIDARIHFDESTPHLHIVLIPIDERHKLNCLHFINGPSGCRALQDSYAKAMEPYGLNRGIDKHITKSRHESHLKWQAEHADNEQALEAYRKTFGDLDDFDLDTKIAFIGNMNSESTNDSIAYEDKGRSGR